MPKIHIVGAPLDLYRYRTFLEVLIDNKNDWGVSLDYNPLIKSEFKRIPVFSKILACFRLFTTVVQIYNSDFVYFPPMVLSDSLKDKVIRIVCDLLKKKVIFDFYISFYDTFVLDRKLVSADSKRAKSLAKVDLWGHTRYRSIYLNRCEAERYRKLNGLNIGENVKIIPLSISHRPSATLSYYKGRKEECFNMVWWGTYIPLHGLVKIIEATEILIKEGRNVHLYILGNNADLSKNYLNIIEQKGLTHCITISNDMTFSNGKLLPFIIGNCHLAFGAFGDSEKARTVILNKAIEAITMKIPVLTQHSKAFEEFFSPDSTLFYCNNTPEKMADQIGKIMDLPFDIINSRLEKAYEIYNHYFSITASQKMFEELLSELKEECQLSRN